MWNVFVLIFLNVVFCLLVFCCWLWWWVCWLCCWWWICVFWCGDLLIWRFVIRFIGMYWVFVNLLKFLLSGLCRFLMICCVLMLIGWLGCVFFCLMMDNWLVGYVMLVIVLILIVWLWLKLMVCWLLIYNSVVGLKFCFRLLVCWCSSWLVLW